MAYGRVKQITTRGRIALEVGDRLVVAEIHSGGGGWVGDEVEGPMRLGTQTWRHTQTGMLSVVNVFANDVPLEHLNSALQVRVPRALST
jgi:hypothetical protein